MYIHREGKKLLLGLGAVIMLIYLLMIFFVNHWTFFHFLFITILLIFFIMVMKNPKQFIFKTLSLNFHLLKEFVNGNGIVKNIREKK